MDSPTSPRVTAKGHITVTRDGRVVAVFSGTPSDWRSMRNALARLRRADPEALFDRMAQLMAAGYAQRMGAQR